VIAGFGVIERCDAFGPENVSVLSPLSDFRMPCISKEKNDFSR